MTENELCPICNGTGTYTTGWMGSPLGSYPEEDVCPICDPSEIAPGYKVSHYKHVAKMLEIKELTALRAERDALAAEVARLQKEVKELTTLAMNIRYAAAFGLDNGDATVLRPTLEQVHGLACEATD